MREPVVRADEVLLLPAEVDQQKDIAGGEIHEQPREFVNNFYRELYTGVSNILLFQAEHVRDAYHGDSPTFNAGYVPTEKIIPLQTEGVIGFLDQHMGNSLETLGAIYGWRVPIEMVARVYETMSDKKVNPHHKMALAILLGTFTTGVLEMTKSNGDKLDWFGSLLAGLWASGSWATAHYLSKPRETSLFDQGWDRWTSALQKVKTTNKEVVVKVQQMVKWGGGLMTDMGKGVDTILESGDTWMRGVGETHEKALTYLESEAHVAELMFKDFVDRQTRRWLSVDKGNDVGEI